VDAPPVRIDDIRDLLPESWDDADDRFFPSSVYSRLAHGAADLMVGALCENPTLDGDRERIKSELTEYIRRVKNLLDGWHDRMLIQIDQL
jgi:hypothetical protein